MTLKQSHAVPSINMKAYVDKVTCSSFLFKHEFEAQCALLSVAFT